MFPCSAGHEQDRQLCPVDLYSAKSADDTYINNSITDTFQRTTKSGGLRWVRTRLEVHGRVAHEFSSPLSVMFARPLRPIILVCLYRIKITTFASYTFHIYDGSLPRFRIVYA